MPDKMETHASWDSEQLAALYDPAKGLIDRRIYSDEGIYRLELERIFARAWNFVCHDSQIPNPGDYFISYIGEDQVICVRDAEGRVNVLLNTCRHRGNALCRAEQGNAKSFVCSYHGWHYALNGDLIGVPGQSTYYHGKLDKSRLGLAKAAQVDSYLGFHFATLSPDAPPLMEYLGDVGRTGLGMLGLFEDTVVLDGIQKNIIDCNWKIAVDNLFDWYHVAYSHASADTAGFFEIPKILHPNNQFVMLGEYGHAISGPAVPKEAQAAFDKLSDEERRRTSTGNENLTRIRPRKATELLGPAGVRSLGHPNIFPNLWITLDGIQMCLRIPRGPHATELWWFTMVGKNAPDEFRKRAMFLAMHAFGPAGLLEQDDGENWSQSTRASRGVASRKLGHTLVMGLGEDDVTLDNSGQRYIETKINEHGQRWHYRAWLDWMQARDWAELKARHAPSPSGKV